MKELLCGKLNIIVEDEPNNITMTWLGESREINPSSFLDPYLTEVVTQVKTKNNKSLVVDFTKLHTMNSSTVKPILLFIRLLEEKGVKAEILYDDKLSWQRASFLALAAITRFYKFVKVKSK